MRGEDPCRSRAWCGWGPRPRASRRRWRSSATCSALPSSGAPTRFRSSRSRAGSGWRCSGPGTSTSRSSTADRWWSSGSTTCRARGRSWRPGVSSSCTRTTPGASTRGPIFAAPTGTSTGSPAARTGPGHEPSRRSASRPEIDVTGGGPSRRSEPELPVVVAMTGATGAIYGIRLLQALGQAGVETHLVLSRWAEATILAETSWKPTDVRALADHVWDEDDLEAPPASGSLLTRGMLVAPCSMKSLAAIAHGITENLIHRAAEVTMKERRTLLLLVREAPLSV